MTEKSKKVKGKLFKKIIQDNDDIGFGLREVYIKSREELIHPNVYPLQMKIQGVDTMVESAEALCGLTIRDSEIKAIYELLRDTIVWAEEQTESMTEEKKKTGKVKDSKLIVLDYLAQFFKKPGDLNFKEIVTELQENTPDNFFPFKVKTVDNEIKELTDLGELLVMSTDANHVIYLAKRLEKRRETVENMKDRPAPSAVKVEIKPFDSKEPLNHSDCQGLLDKLKAREAEYATLGTRPPPISLELLLPETTQDQIKNLLRGSKKYSEMASYFMTIKPIPLMKALVDILKHSSKAAPMSIENMLVSSMSLPKITANNWQWSATYYSLYNGKCRTDFGISIDNLTTEQSKVVLEHLHDTWQAAPDELIRKTYEFIWLDNDEGPVPENMSDFFLKLTRASQSLSAASRWTTATAAAAKKQHSTERESAGGVRAERDGASKNRVAMQKTLCIHCGDKLSRGFCSENSCSKYKHPHINKDKKLSFAESHWGQVYATIKDWKRPVLPHNKEAKKDGEEYELIAWANPDTGSGNKRDRDNGSSKKRDRDNGRRHVSHLAQLQIDNYTNNNSTYNPIVSASTTNGFALTNKVLLDTGAHGESYINNYITESLLAKLRASYTPCECAEVEICTATSCFKNKNCAKLDLVLSNTIGQTKTVHITVRVVKQLPYDIIIGFTTIRQYRLTRVFDTLFEEVEGVEQLFSRAEQKYRDQQQTKATALAEVVLNNLVDYESPVRYWTHDRMSSSYKRRRSILHDGSSCDCNAAALMEMGQPSIGRPHTDMCKQCVPKEGQLYTIRRETVGCMPDPPDTVSLTKLTASALYSVNQTQYYHSRLKLLSPLASAILQRSHLMTLRIPKEQLLDIEDDSDNIDSFIDETPIDRLCVTKVSEDLSDEGLFSKMKVEGSPHFLDKYKKFVSKYNTSFRTNLTSEAAKLDAFELELETNSDWQTSQANRQRPRPQSKSKLDATDLFIANALEAGLIEESQAEHWSQILLTPKSNGDWRFCVDFRHLNQGTKSMGWPLPNIKQMLQRIGAKRPKYFAVLDLTQGYYQMAISKKSRDLTSFITHKGLYRWRRLPMGLKGAPAFFQQAVQTKVLQGLMYECCELYIDDVIVYADSEEELLAKLDKVFARFKAYNITVNPAKVKLGLKQIEYVGHTIDETGLHFSRSKIEDVLKTPKPQTHKELKSFLGLCVQFSDHITRYSDLVKPLNAMILNYSKKKANIQLVWTPETSVKFKELLEAVNTCPKLFFYQEGKGEIFLHTDASQYGIGGYLFQKIDGKSFPIAIISRTLNSTELRWSTPEKEAYAIFYCLMKLEHLLRDTHFILRTDHKNLTFLNADFREKVKRWKLAVQHFDFEVEYIKGPDNVEADGFSRLCPEREHIELTDKKEKEIFLQALKVVHDLSVLCREPELKSDKCYLNSIRTQLNPIISSYAYEKISNVHNDLVGHFGFDKTKQRLRNSEETWKGMDEDIKNYIEKCDFCQKNTFIKAINNDIVTMPFSLASYAPFERICVDTIGPIKTDDETKKFILVIIDAFSRFIQLHAISDTTAITAVDSIMNWIGHFGIPSEVVSDNGTQFANEVVDELLNILQVKNTKIQAYSHEENGIVERANKEVNRHLRAIVYSRKKRVQYYKYLPLVQRIMNASVHSSIGVSPAQIVFGNTVHLDRQLLPVPDKTQNFESYSEYMQDMMSVQADIIASAQKAQRDTDEYNFQKRMKKHDGKQITEFPINSYVLVNYESTDNKPPTKLHTFLHGPLRVVSHIGPIYTLQNLVTMKNEDFHVKLLHPYEYEEDKTNPEDSAQHDTGNKGNEYFEIIDVKNHRFIHPQKIVSNLEFLIHWEGESDYRWSAYSPSVIATEIVQNYCRQNELIRFIPAQYKYARDDPRYEKPIKKKRSNETGERKRPRKKRKFGLYMTKTTST